MPDRERTLIGLISGTSADGIDAALVTLRGRFPALKIKLLAFETFPYPGRVREEVFRVFRSVEDPAGGCAPADLPRLDVLLGELFADSALALISKAGFPASQVDAIASHGQTLYHQPLPVSVAGRPVRCTFQAADGSVIAQRSGIRTISDFRTADMAAGGEGAPLVPMADFILFRHPGKNRAVLNIGGIANLTCLPAGGSSDDVTAFDSGPGNMPMDGIISIHTSGSRHFDEGGSLASGGRVHEALLKRWLEHPYFKRTPPKSTGREEFGELFIRRIMAEAASLPFEDLAATVSALTADSIALGLTKYFPVADEMIAAGGGTHNLFIMERLKKALPAVSIHNSSEYGIPVDAREAVAFAILGDLTLKGQPGNLPSATGAARPVILGKISPVWPAGCGSKRIF
ncbi:MAG: anhydro-N-acetylmuramic acid kinase [bacterium]